MRYRRTDWQTDWRMDRPSYRDAFLTDASKNTIWEYRNLGVFVFKRFDSGIFLNFSRHSDNSRDMRSNCCKNIIEEINTNNTTMTTTMTMITTMMERMTTATIRMAINELWKYFILMLELGFWRSPYHWSYQQSSITHNVILNFAHHVMSYSQWLIILSTIATTTLRIICPSYAIDQNHVSDNDYNFAHVT